MPRSFFKLLCFISYIFFHLHTKTVLSSILLERKVIADLGRSAFMYTHQRTEKLTPGALFPANLKGMGGALKEIDVNIDMNKERVGDKKLLPTPT